MGHAQAGDEEAEGRFEFELEIGKMRRERTVQVEGCLLFARRWKAC